MEVPGKCAACGQERLVLDAIHGVLACDACGTVGNQAETELRSECQTGHILERRGIYVGESDNGVSAAKALMRGQISSHSFFTEYPRWDERYRLETMKKVESITALLRVPGDKVDQAKQLLESVLKGDWGIGRWVDILVAACVYIVIRQSQLPLTVPEVADCVNCDVIELGRMYNRILQQLEITLPNVDALVFLERAASTIPVFKKLDKDLVRKIKKQANSLLDYAQVCFIATGRRPLPVVAAVLSLAVEANGIVVGIAEVARELHAGIWATKKRYKECQAALVGIGQGLPWGKDITLKTVPRHLPFLFKYLELKVKLEKNRRHTDLQGDQPLHLASSSDEHHLQVAPQTLGSTDEVCVGQSYIDISSCGSCHLLSKRSFDGIFSGPTACESTKGSEDRSLRGSKNENQENQPGPDTVSRPVLDERSSKLLKMTGDSHSGGSEMVCSIVADTEVKFSSVDNGREQVQDISRITQRELVTRDSLPQSVASEQVLKYRNWEGLPAAFCASLEARTRRRIKIDLAKVRIAQARKTLKDMFEKASVASSIPAQSGLEQCRPNAELSNKSNNSLDWEDLLIEHLVLCGASEAELENGYYRSLLALYPEQQGTELIDEDPASYLRSRSEVELLLEITGRPEGDVVTQRPLLRR